MDIERTLRTLLINRITDISQFNETLSDFNQYLQNVSRITLKKVLVHLNSMKVRIDPQDFKNYGQFVHNLLSGNRKGLPDIVSIEKRMAYGEPSPVQLMACKILAQIYNGNLKITSGKVLILWKNHTDRFPTISIQRFKVDRKKTVREHKLRRIMMYVILKMIYFGTLIFEQSAFWRWKLWYAFHMQKYVSIEIAAKNLLAVVESRKMKSLFNNWVTCVKQYPRRSYLKLKVFKLLGNRTLRMGFRLITENNTEKAISNCAKILKKHIAKRLKHWNNRTLNRTIQALKLKNHLTYLNKRILKNSFSRITGEKYRIKNALSRLNRIKKKSIGQRLEHWSHSVNDSRIKGLKLKNILEKLPFNRFRTVLKQLNCIHIDRAVRVMNKYAKKSLSRRLQYWKNVSNTIKNKLKRIAESYRKSMVAAFNQWKIADSKYQIAKMNKDNEMMKKAASLKRALKKPLKRMLKSGIKRSQVKRLNEVFNKLSKKAVNAAFSGIKTIGLERKIKAMKVMNCLRNASERHLKEYIGKLKGNSSMLKAIRAVKSIAISNIRNSFNELKNFSQKKKQIESVRKAQSLVKAIKRPVKRLLRKPRKGKEALQNLDKIARKKLSSRFHKWKNSINDHKIRGFKLNSLLKSIYNRTMKSSLSKLAPRRIAMKSACTLLNKSALSGMRFAFKRMNKLTNQAKIKKISLALVNKCLNASAKSYFSAWKEAAKDARIKGYLKQKYFAGRSQNIGEMDLESMVKKPLSIKFGLMKLRGSMIATKDAFNIWKNNNKRYKKAIYFLDRLCKSSLKSAMFELKKASAFQNSKPGLSPQVLETTVSFVSILSSLFSKRNNSHKQKLFSSMKSYNKILLRLSKTMHNKARMDMRNSLLNLYRNVVGYKITSNNVLWKWKICNMESQFYTRDLVSYEEDTIKGLKILTNIFRRTLYHNMLLWKTHHKWLTMLMLRYYSDKIDSIFNICEKLRLLRLEEATRALKKNPKSELCITKLYLTVKILVMKSKSSTMSIIKEAYLK